MLPDAAQDPADLGGPALGPRAVSVSTARREMRALDAADYHGRLTGAIATPAGISDGHGRDVATP